MSQTCDSCGARIREGAERCDLCGMKVGGEPDDWTDDPDTMSEPDDSGGDGAEPEGIERAEAERDGAERTSEEAGAFCNQCGWRNPPGANFCSRCGAKLQQIPSETAGAAAQSSGEPRRTSTTPASPPLTETSDREESDSTAGMGRQVVVIVGAGILFVIALYMITVLSAENNRSSDPAPQTTATATVDEPPLTEQFVPRETELLERLDEASDSTAVDIRRDLMDLYLSANRIDLAAGEAESIAEITNTENDWAVAGNMYYDVMESREDASRTVYAKRAIAAYGRALEINPDNLDVRTDMAIAYMYDPDNPMMAIQETNRVLEQDSLHIQANFNRGVMLANINRIDQAIDQFERVKQIIGDESNPIYQRAEQAIESVQGAAR